MPNWPLLIRESKGADGYVSIKREVKETNLTNKKIGFVLLLIDELFKQTGRRDIDPS